MKISTTRLRIYAAALGLILSLSPGMVQAKPEITVGASKTAMLIWLAKANGYLEDADITVTVQGISSGIVASGEVSDGEITFGTGSEFAFTSKLMDGGDVCIYATISSSRTTRLISRADMVGPDPLDLVGKRIAVTPNGVGQYFLSQFLLLSGIDEASVTLVPASPTEAVELIATGQVESAMTWEPHSTNVRSALGDLAIEYEDQSDQYYYFTVMGQCTLEDHELQGLQVLLAGIRKAEEFASRSPDEAKAALSKVYGIPLEDINRIWPLHSLTLSLPQDLLTAIESEAQWRIENGVSEGPLPDVLSVIRPKPLLAVDPAAVRMIQ